MRWPWTSPPETDPDLVVRSAEQKRRIETKTEDLAGVYLQLKSLLRDIRREEGYGPPE